jgi:phospholipase D
MKILLILILLLINCKAKADEVCFSPAINKSMTCQNMIIKQIMSSKQSLKIAVFDFTDQEILEQINLAKIARVKVYFVLDKRQAKGKHSLSSDILSEYDNVKIISGKRGGVMHNKYIIIDDNRVITGSYNWSKGALHKNDENAVLLEDENIVKQYVNHFNSMYF